MKGIPFEIHLTSRLVNETNLPQFENICKECGGKALLIELSEGEHFLQPMSSIILYDNGLESVLQKSEVLVKRFQKEGFDIQRVKIEIPPKDKFLLQLEKTATQYYEWHGKVFFEKIEILQAICKENDAHLSKNALKNAANFRFLTIRAYSDEVFFNKKVEKLIEALAEKGWAIEKQQFEFCIYDNHVQLDKGWAEN
jgi:hypothetical protein